MHMTRLLLLLAVTPLMGFGQVSSGKHLTGEDYARQEIQMALKNNGPKPFYDTLIGDKETAINVAESILFKIYGKENIISERPYKTYLIDGYWYLSGTLPKGYLLGGTFEIIIYSINGQVIKLMHGK
jgi:hypothetical protein